MICIATKVTTARRRSLARLWDRKRRKLILVSFLCYVLFVAVLMTFFSRTSVQGSSMDNTLHDGQNLIMLRADTNPFLTPKPGDIVVAEWNDILIVKRVIAGPGDTLKIVNNEVYRNGQLLREDYIKEPMITKDISAMTLGDDAYFLMGDNRNESADSRAIGLLTRQQIRGVIYLEHQILLLCAMAGTAVACVIMAVMAPSMEDEKAFNPQKVK